MQLEMSFPDMVEALERKHGSLNAASRKADIPLGTLFRIKRREADPRYSTLVKIADALDSTVPQLLTEYGGNPDSPHDTDQPNRNAA